MSKPKTPPTTYFPPGSPEELEEQICRLIERAEITFRERAVVLEKIADKYCKIADWMKDEE